LQKERAVENILKLNKIIVGEHSYYAYATMVSEDFARINYNLSKCLKRRLKSLILKTKKKKCKKKKIEKKGYKTREYLKRYDKYQEKPQILLGIYRCPLYGIATRTPYMFK
jgi:RNA-directed DNA polymerase